MKVESVVHNLSPADDGNDRGIVHQLLGQQLPVSRIVVDAVVTCNWLPLSQNGRWLNYSQHFLYPFRLRWKWASDSCWPEYLVHVFCWIDFRPTRWIRWSERRPCNSTGPTTGKQSRPSYWRSIFASGTVPFNKNYV